MSETFLNKFELISNKASHDEGTWPPLSEFMIHVWRRHSLHHKYDLKCEKSRWDYLLWFIFSLAQERNYSLTPIPSELIDVLNEIVWDTYLFSDEVTTKLGGTTVNRPLSRFMMLLWQRARKDDNVATGEGYKDFIEWYFYDLIFEGKLDSRLLPIEVAKMLKWPTYQSIEFLPNSWSIRLVAKRHFGNEYLAILHDSDRYTEFLVRVMPNFIERGLLSSVPEEVKNFWINMLDQDVDSTLDNDVLTKALHAKFTNIKNEKPHEMQEGICILGPLGAVSGLGNALRASVMAFETQNLQLQLRNFSLDQRFEKLSKDFVGSIERHTNFLQKNLCTLIHVNLENIPDVVLQGRSDYPYSPYSICYTFWEIDTIVPAHNLGIKCVDEIWTSSEFNRKIYADKVNIPVINVGIVVDIPQFKQEFKKSSFGFDDQTCVFMFSFDSNSSIERKNPVAVVEAFLHAFPKGNEKVGLILKTQNSEAGFGVRGRLEQLLNYVSADGRIRFINRSMPKGQYYALKSMIDCYISLHRSEGFGYGPAEAMLLGKPVIVTNYSGNCDFTRKDNSFLVNYGMKRILPGEYYYDSDGAYWAEPDVEHAAHHMRYIFANYGDALKRAQRGQELMRKKYSPQKVGMNYRKRLVEIGLLK